MSIAAIDKLGGPEAVAARLRSEGRERISERAVRAWKSRGSVPGYAVTAMWRWAGAAGIDLRPEDFEPHVRRSAA